MISPSKVHFFLLRGLEDLPDSISATISLSLGVKPFNSNWFDKKEHFKTKLLRLNNDVDAALKEDKIIYFIGVSAGASLAMAYFLHYPKKVSFIYSVCGLLNPNLHRLKLTRFIKMSHSFHQTARYLTSHLTPKNIEKYNLADKVSAYSSTKDDLVPLKASEPSWVTIKKRIKVQHRRPRLNRLFRWLHLTNHVSTITDILLEDIKKQRKLFE